MNETRTNMNHPQPPRWAQMVINSVITAVLRSRWHRFRSDHLLLITFTGRKSGREFTTPIRYTQAGEILRVGIPVVYSWWKNLAGGAAVRVLLRGQTRTGIAEVLPEKEGLIPVHIHLQG